MAIRPFHSHVARGRICLYLAVLLLLAARVNAQLQQPFVYTTGGAVVATPRRRHRRPCPHILFSPTVLGFPAVLDAKGRFFFAAGNNSIHMYQVDSVTGSYTEVSGSPFASTNTNSPYVDCHRTNRRVPCSRQFHRAKPRGK